MMCFPHPLTRFKTCLLALACLFSVSLFSVGLLSTGKCWAEVASSNASSNASSQLQQATNEARLGKCYARWTATTLTIGNEQFERRWRIDGGQLVCHEFIASNTSKKWSVATKNAKQPPLFELQVTSSVERYSPVSREMLTLTLQEKKQAPAIRLQLLPEMAGILVTRIGSAADASTNRHLKRFAAFQQLAIAPLHLRVTEVELVDQTDGHNELVFEDEWLLAPSDGLVSLRGNVAVFEDSISGGGLALVKLAPLPHARPETVAADFRINGKTRLLQVGADEYPIAMIAYGNEPLARIAALQKLQRTLRIYDANRDGRFLSNTWGDRSRDARINEQFIQQEITAAKRLGIDVLQIDDGWQKGRSKNSASRQARDAGVWNNFWEQDPQFWDSDPARFPRGLSPLTDEAAQAGVKLGLWFAPDSSNSLANWQKDASRLLELHRNAGIDYFKLDAIKATSTQAVANQRRLFDTVLAESEGQVSFDLDVTAEIRPGYFGAPHVGPLFVENRYTDHHSYWPHQTLRNLWQLSHYVDPLRLRMEFLNVDRNIDKYNNDPLAPNLYRYDTLFAMTMFANPLGWFEASNLPERAFSELPPLVKTWRQHRARLHQGVITPIGAPPDGMAWTGFASVNEDDKSAYVLLFRELNQAADFHLPLTGLVETSVSSDALIRVEKLGGRGIAAVNNRENESNVLVVTVPKKLDFVWLKLTTPQATPAVATAAGE